MATTDPLGAVETELAVLGRMLESLRRRSAIHRDLDRAGYLLTRTVAADGPASINGLARKLGLDPTTVTRQVAALEADGLVVRRGDPDDGRVSVIDLSTKGRQRMASVRAAREDRIEQLLHGWSAAERRTFATLLGRFNAALLESPPVPA
jgi:DNA-binding MarR family transcriptional regulator